MKRLIVTECYGAIPISRQGGSGALSDRQADELSQYVERHVLDADLIRIGRDQVRFVNYVGFLRMSDYSIEVLPKVHADNLGYSRKILLRMLARSGYLEISESEADQLEIEEMDLFEILSLLYVRRVTRELVQGVIRTYVSVEDELQTLRGRINVPSQMRTSHRMSTAVPCIYDEFDSNHELNQVLKAALVKVVRLTAQPRIRTMAAHALTYLEEVDERAVVAGLRAQIGKRRPRFDRLNRRFEPSWKLAHLLLSENSPSSRLGGQSTSGLLFKMNELFEHYVGFLLRQAASDVVTKDRSKKLLVKDGNGKQGVFQLEPDYLISKGNGEPSIIVDTKWKVISSKLPRHGVQREDFYQMYAYLTRYPEVGKVILLYPHHDDVKVLDDNGPSEAWHLEGEPGKRLQVYTLDYDNEEEALERVKEMIF
ncbi:hypothetical protein [Paenibacillus sp. RC67]|uniref:McrC family protein n=1 Tax=Paenibacillus sp. RC67 TaxID=3039392 RepID=UPI0024AE82CC|nr:hypothetical protein [Paenibacillus sp. RC67]